MTDWIKISVNGKKNIYSHCRYDFSDSNRHGTRCAGQVAATPNNTLCIVGIAFNAQIGGIRMLDGQVISIIISIVSISRDVLFMLLLLVRCRTQWRLSHYLSTQTISTSTGKNSSVEILKIM